MNIFFDLDGTLLDSRCRLYGLFRHLVQNTSFTFDEYWTLKRSKVSHQQILQDYFNYSKEELQAFHESWMSNIELREWLQLDVPFEGVTDFLHSISGEHTLYLVTARQSKQMAALQIEQFGWSDLFKDIFVTEQRLQKYELIADAVIVSKEDWFVGDTGKDIQTGKQLKMNTAAVLSGFLSEKSILEYEPDLIVDDVTKLKFNQDDRFKKH